MTKAYTIECVVTGSGFRMSMTSLDLGIVSITAILTLMSIWYGFYLLRTCGSDRILDDELIQSFVEKALAQRSQGQTEEPDPKAGADPENPGQ